MTDDVREFLDELNARLEAGAREYGNQSFVKPIAATVREILEEQIDQVGWTYVLWSQAARKAMHRAPEQDMRRIFLQQLEHRIRRNDRRHAQEGGYAAQSQMAELEVLALDLFLQNAELRRRLLPIARAIEVAHVIDPRPYDQRGRYGSTRDPRSDD